MARSRIATRPAGHDPYPTRAASEVLTPGTFGTSGGLHQAANVVLDQALHHTVGGLERVGFDKSAGIHTMSNGGGVSHDHAQPLREPVQ